MQNLYSDFTSNWWKGVFDRGEWLCKEMGANMVKHTLLWDKYTVKKGEKSKTKQQLRNKNQIRNHSQSNPKLTILLSFSFPPLFLLLTHSLHPKSADMVHQFTPLCTVSTCFFTSLQMDEWLLTGNMFWMNILDVLVDWEREGGKDPWMHVFFLNVMLSREDFLFYVLKCVDKEKLLRGIR